MLQATAVTVSPEISYLDVIRRRARRILDLDGACLRRRSIPEERWLEIFWSSHFGVMRLSFPIMEPTRMSLSPFEFGLRQETERKVRWVLWAPTGGFFEQAVTHTFSGEEAIAVRLAVLAEITKVPDAAVWSYYRSGWGSGFETQCIRCGCVYALGLGWSQQEFPIIPAVPKIGCPLCIPEPDL